MRESFEVVQRGFVILHQFMKGSIGQDFNRVDHSIHKLSFKRGDLDIYGELYLPDQAKSSATVIIGHGFGATYQTMASDARAFARAGITSYIFDFCGGSLFSSSGGRMRDMSVLTERDDMEAVMDGLRSLSCIDKDNIFLAGESQGGFVAALLAAKRPEDVKGLILFYPALIIPDDARVRFDSPDDIPETARIFGVKVGRRYFSDVFYMDPFKEISAYDKDVLIIHGDRDSIVPVAYSERAVRSYAKAKLIVIHRAGHGFYGSDLKKADDIVIDYIMAHVGNDNRKLPDQGG